MCESRGPGPSMRRHPCLHAPAATTARRVHLPVAPACNVRCNYCDRRSDCVNESRPGVSSALMSPRQALARLREVVDVHRDVSVVGIAGPGDPFATPGRTLETLSLVRRAFGEELLLCVATNGLALAPHVDDLVRLGVQFVTVTVNAVDPAIGAQIYGAVLHGGEVLSGEDGFPLLLEAQFLAIQQLKAHAIHVKVNAVVIPGVNASHVPAVARAVARCGVDTFNCVGLHPVRGTPMGELRPPDPTEMAAVRSAVGAHLPVMKHCARCRADATGLLAGPPNPSERGALVQTRLPAPMLDVSSSAPLLLPAVAPRMEARRGVTLPNEEALHPKRKQSW